MIDKAQKTKILMENFNKYMNEASLTHPKYSKNDYISILTKFLVDFEIEYQDDPHAMMWNTGGGGSSVSDVILLIKSIINNIKKLPNDEKIWIRHLSEPHNNTLLSQLSFNIITLHADVFTTEDFDEDRPDLGTEYSDRSLILNNKTYNWDDLKLNMLLPILNAIQTSVKEKAHKKYEKKHRQANKYLPF